MESLIRYAISIMKHKYSDYVNLIKMKNNLVLKVSFVVNLCKKVSYGFQDF